MRWSLHLPLRPPPHRLLRLLLAVGGAAAGLCLVLGIVTFVISMGPGPRATPDTGGTHRTARPRRSRRKRRRPLGGQNGPYAERKRR